MTGLGTELHKEFKKNLKPKIGPLRFLGFLKTLKSLGFFQSNFPALCSLFQSAFRTVRNFGLWRAVDIGSFTGNIVSPNVSRYALLCKQACHCWKHTYASLQAPYFGYRFRIELQKEPGLN